MNTPYKRGLAVGLRRMRECPNCHGYGSSLREDAERCTRCGGSGLVPDAFDCPNCGQVAVSADDWCPDFEVNARARADGRPGPRHSRERTSPPA